MWQELREEIHRRGCELVTVALDATGGARAARFLEKASPRHPALIDQSHLSTRLFGFVNIPSSVWIDERGWIVRPAETAPRPPSESHAEPRPLPEGIPERMKAIAKESANIVLDAADYHDALADWVENGRESRFALTPEQVVERSRPRNTGAAKGQAHFELATYLEAQGDHLRAIHHFREAQRLAPDNWLYRRQAWSLEPGPNRFWQGPTPDKPEAWPYVGDWLTDIRREGAENYYERFHP